MRTYDPFRELESFSREAARLLELAAPNVLRRNAFLPGRSARSYPLINVTENAEAVLVEALAPGIAPDSLEINVLPKQMTIAGQKEAPAGDLKPEAWHRNERATGKFVRTLALPTEVDPDAVTAEYRNGILYVTMNKADAAKPRKIDVKVAS